MRWSVTNILARPIFFAAAVGGMVVAARGAESLRAAQFSKVGDAPLYFERNAGQLDATAPFVARGTECTVLLAPTEAEILLGKASDNVLHTRTVARSVRLQLVGANPAAEMSGAAELGAKVNYFIGSEPAAWHTGVPLFAKVRAEEVYPGVGMIYYGNQSAQLEYDFVLQPGTAADQIHFRITGADDVRVDAAGNLVLKVDGQELCQHQPVAYQENSGVRKAVAASYRINADGTVGFALAAYDHSRQLTIDPALDFVSYIGGKKIDIGHSVAIDPSGNVYVAGETLSTGLLTTNFIQFGSTNFSKFRGGNNAFGDAFVAKYNGSGALQFLTYLGGKTDDGALGIAYDPTGGGAVWVTGFTDSTNFPLVNPLPWRTQLSGANKNALHTFPVDAFISKLDPSGTSLQFSTLFGADSIDEGVGIAVDPSGGVYVTGLTSSTNLPTMPANVYQPKFGGAFDGFATKLTGAGSVYTNAYITYLGGTNVEYGLSIAVDSGFHAWVAGVTFSVDFPTTNALTLAPGVSAYFTNGATFTNLNTQAEQPKQQVRNNNFSSDAFVTELTSDGTSSPFSTYLGGTNDDVAQSIAIDGSDNVYVAGYTTSIDFPTNVITAQSTNFLGYDPTTVVFPNIATNFSAHVFVTEIASHAFGPSTHFGGSFSDQGRAVAVDNNGLVYVTGSASSTNLFATNMIVLTNSVIVTNKHHIIYPGFSVLNPTYTNLSSTNVISKLRHNGNTNDVFVAVLAPGFSNFVYSIQFGGTGRDEANAIAVDPSGKAVYLVGTTSSITNFATTNAAQRGFGGGGGGVNGRLSDAFVGKIQIVPGP